MKPSLGDLRCGAGLEAVYLKGHTDTHHAGRALRVGVAGGARGVRERGTVWTLASDVSEELQATTSEECEEKSKE